MFDYIFLDTAPQAETPWGESASLVVGRPPARGALDIAPEADVLHEEMSPPYGKGIDADEKWGA
jgi:hypothetical protein